MSSSENSYSGLVGVLKLDPTRSLSQLTGLFLTIIMTITLYLMCRMVRSRDGSCPLRNVGKCCDSVTVVSFVYHYITYGIAGIC